MLCTPNTDRGAVIWKVSYSTNVLSSASVWFSWSWQKKIKPKNVEWGTEKPSFRYSVCQDLSREKESSVSRSVRREVWKESEGGQRKGAQVTVLSSLCHSEIKVPVPPGCHLHCTQSTLYSPYRRSLFCFICHPGGATPSVLHSFPVVTPLPGMPHILFPLIFWCSCSYNLKRKENNKLFCTQLLFSLHAGLFFVIQPFAFDWYLSSHFTLT